jgi:transcriptional activator SPT8
MAQTREMKWVLTGSNDGCIRKFDLQLSLSSTNKVSSNIPNGIPDGFKKSAECVGVIEISNPVYSLACHSQALWGICGSTKGSCSLITLRHDEGTSLHSFVGHSDVVSCIQLDSTEKSFLSGSWDNSILLWDLNNGNVIQKFTDHKSQITCIQFNPVISDVFFSSSANGEVILRDLRVPHSSDQGIKHFTPSGKIPPWCLSACWTPDGHSIYVGRRNECVDGWDLRNFGALPAVKLPSGSGPVSFVTMLPGGENILIASNDSVRIWDLTFQRGTSERLVPFTLVPGHNGGMISSVLLSGDGGLMATSLGNRGMNFLTENHHCLFYSMER